MTFEKAQGGYTMTASESEWETIRRVIGWAFASKILFSKTEVQVGKTAEKMIFEEIILPKMSKNEREAVLGN